ncbi:hypothetical protein SEA_CULVER_114 [Gordonia phage Culver]|nr:hypothetical protein SEA_CULVER_114 [Gordonia phage Culver]
MSDAYSKVRREEHSTLGDAIERFDRDQDAFTAGVQYALDKLIAIQILSIAAGDYIESISADILTRVHEGRL